MASRLTFPALEAILLVLLFASSQALSQQAQPLIPQVGVGSNNPAVCPPEASSSNCQNQFIQSVLNPALAGLAAGSTGKLGQLSVLTAGFNQSITSVFDNGPLVQQLMNTIAPVSPNADAGYQVIFPANNSQNQTYYYFSQPLLMGRGGNFFCGQDPNRTAASVNLIFAPGVDGIIWDAGFFTPDGGFSSTNVQGCAIRSLGFGQANTSNSSNQITSAFYAKVYGPISGPGYSVGDGLIVKDKSYLGNPLAVTPGTTITNVNGSTLTLSSTPNATLTNAATYQLPAAQAYSVTTASGSNSVTITSGPNRLIQSGDLIWSDAFTFGCLVWSETGAVGGQTITIVDARANNTACNATVTHTSGSGKLWVVPAGLKRNWTSHSQYNYVFGWPVGLLMPCASGMTPTINCTLSDDRSNGYESNLVGRWVTGNNTGASTSVAETFNHNYRYDVLEDGGLGSTYVGLFTGSLDSSNSPDPVVGSCGGLNFSTFIGGYSNNTGTGYCVTAADPYNGAIAAGTISGTAMFIGPISGVANDVSSLSAGGFTGQIYFEATAPSNPNPGQFTCLELAGGDPSKTNGVNFAFSFNCQQATRFHLAYSFASDIWQWGFFNNFIYEYLAGPNYTGYMGDAAGFFNYVYYPNGFMLNGEPGTQGNERLFDSRTAIPSGTWQKQGDVSLNRSATAGGTAGWIDTASGANFHPMAPVSVDTAGNQWSLPIVILTNTTFSGLPSCVTALKGARQFISDGAAAPTFSAAAAGGGSLFTPVYCDGSSWRNG